TGDDGQRYAVVVDIGSIGQCPRAVDGDRAALDGDPGRRVEAAYQLSGWTKLQDLSVVHDRDPVAERLRLVHVVRGQHDRAALYRTGTRTCGSVRGWSAARRTTTPATGPRSAVGARGYAARAGCRTSGPRRSRPRAGPR